MSIREIIAFVILVLGAFYSSFDFYLKVKKNKRAVRQYSNLVLGSVLVFTLLSFGWLFGFYSRQDNINTLLSQKIEYQKKYFNTSKKLTEEIKHNNYLNEKALLNLQLQNQLLSEEIDKLNGKTGRPVADRVEFYEHINFVGNRSYLAPGDYPDLQLLWMNDKISSVKIKGNLKLIVFEDVNMEGKALPLNESISSLVSTGLNDKISSIRILEK